MATSLTSQTSPPSGHQVVQSLSWLSGKRFWLIPAGFLVVVGIYITLLRVSPTDPITQRQIISESGQVLSLLFLLSLCLVASFRAKQERIRWAWRCFALAFATYTCAEVIFGYESIVIFAGNSTPTPTLADFFYLPFYPLMSAGLLLLPSEETTNSSRLRAIVDAMITVGAVLGFGLIYLITPNFQGGASLVTVLVLVAYPVGDTILVLTLIFLVTRGIQASYRPLFAWLTIGLVSFIFADVSFDYRSLLNDYVVGAINVDPFWTIGELTMAIAPLFYLIHGEDAHPDWQWLRRLGQRQTTVSVADSTRRFIIPYLSVAVLIALVISHQPKVPSDSFFPTLEVLLLLIVALVVARQFLISRDLVDAQVANVRAQQLDDLKNQFITSVNHELRTPLMTMQAYIELLRVQQQELPAETRATVIEEVGRTSDALVDLVQSILEVRRLDTDDTDFPRQAVPVYATIEKATALINPREGRVAERDLRVQVPRSLAIWGEPVRLQQILTNLLSNAIKYSPPGTPIEVGAQLIEANRVPGLKRRQQRPMCEIIVRDHGFGIPKDQMPLLFNRFVRLPRDLASNIVGSGLGLFLCRALAEVMDGAIWAESSGVPGEGTIFHLVLPLAPAETKPEDEITLPRLAATRR